MFRIGASPLVLIVYFRGGRRTCLTGCSAGCHSNAPRPWVKTTFWLVAGLILISKTVACGNPWSGPNLCHVAPASALPHNPVSAPAYTRFGSTGSTTITSKGTSSGGLMFTQVGWLADALVVLKTCLGFDAAGLKFEYARYIVSRFVGSNAMPLIV